MFLFSVSHCLPRAIFQNQNKHSRQILLRELLRDKDLDVNILIGFVFFCLSLLFILLVRARNTFFFFAHQIAGFLDGTGVVDGFAFGFPGFDEGVIDIFGFDVLVEVVKNFEADSLVNPFLDG